MFLFVVSFSLMNFTSTKNADEYASLVDDGSIISEDDVYGDLIMASNES